MLFLPRKKIFGRERKPGESNPMEGFANAKWWIPRHLFFMRLAIDFNFRKYFTQYIKCFFFVETRNIQYTFVTSLSFPIVLYILCISPSSIFIQGVYQKEATAWGAGGLQGKSADRVAAKTLKFCSCCPIKI